jgi:hypothetical protein
MQMNSMSLDDLLELLRGLMAKGELEQAILALDASDFRNVEEPALAWIKFEILIGLHRLGDARSEFDRILQGMDDPALLTSLLVFGPQLYDGARRTDIWLALLERTEGLAKRNQMWAQSLSGVRLRLLLALRNYDRFLTAIAEIPDKCGLGGHRSGLLAVAAALREPSFPDHRKPKIFGVGLSRTGTTSLAAALTSIGFHTLHWFNPLTCELISDDHLYLFDAFTDTPVCVNFQKYYDIFPHSKFIYTTRPLDDWKRSVIGHFKRLTGSSGFQELKAAISGPERLPYGAAFRNIHQSLYFDHADYESAYRAYDRQVRCFFQDKPKERFLEFDLGAGHGWPELCAFIGRPPPSAAFPRENRLDSGSDLTCPYVDASIDRRFVRSHATA